MRWPWQRKSKVRVLNVDSRQLMRSTIYDTSVRRPEEIAQALGAPPVSAEGENFEHQQSIKRLSALEGLAPILQAQCAWAATAMVLESFDYDVTDEPEEVARVAAIYTSIIVASVMGILSTLLDQGIFEFASIDE